jgi:hypothetical protein
MPQLGYGYMYPFLVVSCCFFSSLRKHHNRLWCVVVRCGFMKPNLRVVACRNWVMAMCIHFSL